MMEDVSLLVVCVICYIAPDLTLPKCDAAPYFPLSQEQTSASPGTGLRGGASIHKHARPLLSKQRPISYPLLRLPFQRCNASVLFSADAEKTQTTIARPRPLVLALPTISLLCDTAVLLSRHRGILQMLRPLSSQGPTLCNGSSDSTQLYTDVIRISMILRCTLVQ